MNSYVATSTLRRGTDGCELDLATARGMTPSGPVDNPVFFNGFLARPDIASAGVLAVADVAGSRYADVGLAKRLANLDPVVTASGDRLRFESFSACNGVYARFDLMDEGTSAAEIAFGTTNVDINLPLRTALSRIDRNELLHLSIGSDELRASSPAETHVERKVALPDRWVRGLAEVPALARSMELIAEIRGPLLSRFMSELPRVAPPGPHVYVIPFAAGWRTSRSPVPGGIPLPGASRLRGSDRLARYALGLAVHLAPNGTTAWVIDMPGARFTLVISPDPFRGFSGEGTLLKLLVRDDAEHVGGLLAAGLAWSPVVEPARLASTLGLGHAEVEAGLAWLAGSGRVGYDLAEHAWFHRELPIDTDKILRRNPRLVSARKLVDAGAVSCKDGTWRVRGSNPGTVYQVDPKAGCECAWEIEHGGGRGPCKHVLAVMITQERAANPAG